MRGPVLWIRAPNTNTSAGVAEAVACAPAPERRRVVAHGRLDGCCIRLIVHVGRSAVCTVTVAHLTALSTPVG